MAIADVIGALSNLRSMLVNGRRTRVNRLQSEIANANSREDRRSTPRRRPSVSSA
jgi:hypothetical protein